MTATVYAQGSTLINSDIQDDIDNTFILNADDTDGDVRLQFGSALNKYLLWDNTNAQFSFNADVSFGG